MTLVTITASELEDDMIIHRDGQDWLVEVVRESPISYDPDGIMVEVECVIGHVGRPAWWFFDPTDQITVRR